MNSHWSRFLDSALFTFLMAALLGALMAVLMAGGIGCAAPSEARHATDEVAAAVASGEALIADIERDIAGLPADSPLRDKLQTQLAAARDFAAKGKSFIVMAEETIASLESGQVSPMLQAALSGIPGGVYAGFGLAVLLTIQRHLKLQTVVGHAKRIIASWEKVGSNLSAADKLIASAMQGADTTDFVHAVKATLPARTKRPVKIGRGLSRG